jgi:hypothetical protein
MNTRSRYLITAFLMFTVAASVQAQSASVAAREHASLAAASTGDQSANLTQDPGGGSTEDCGPIDPSTPCYATGGGSKEEVCVKATSYQSCLSKCACEYRKNRNKCKQMKACLEGASAENQACTGNCLVDFV